LFIMRILFRGALLALCCSSAAMAQSVSITGGVPAIESFDSLAATGTSGVLPPGWALAETDDNADLNYRAGDGSSNSGDTYSFGTGTDSERALGSLLSGSLASRFGARLQNDTGATLSDIRIDFTMEQWRVGNTSSIDRADFQYSLNANSLGDAAATWVDFDALDLTSVITNGSASPLDGNQSANQSAKTASRWRQARTYTFVGWT
jgi:hypothetical protein